MELIRLTEILQCAGVVATVGIVSRLVERELWIGVERRVIVRSAAVMAVARHLTVFALCWWLLWKTR